MDTNELEQLHALKKAVELMGFDAQRLCNAMRESGTFWQELTLTAVNVEFDLKKARRRVPDLSVVAVAAAKSWLNDVRKPPSEVTQ